jgi:hypothetical protein
MYAFGSTKWLKPMPKLTVRIDPGKEGRRLRRTANEWKVLQEDIGTSQLSQAAKCNYVQLTGQ